MFQAIRPRGTVRNVTVTDSETAISISGGSSGALVKDCTVSGDNLGIFVQSDDSAQVEGCLIQGNGVAGGLFGGQRMLVTGTSSAT